MFNNLGKYIFHENNVSRNDMINAQKAFKLGNVKVRTTLPDDVTINIDENGKVSVPDTEHGKIYSSLQESLKEIYFENRKV